MSFRSRGLDSKLCEPQALAGPCKRSRVVPFGTAVCRPIAPLPPTSKGHKIPLFSVDIENHLLGITVQSVFIVLTELFTDKIIPNYLPLSEFNRDVS